MSAITAEQLPEAIEAIGAVTELVKEGFAALAESVDGVFHAIQEWNSAWIDADYHTHIDGHLTYKIGEGATIGKLRSR